MKGKIWGTTETLEAGQLFEMHRVKVEPGGFCSWHHHERKVNTFVLLAGRLTIETRDETGAVVQLRLSAPGDHAAVRAGVDHRFVNDEWKGETLALEVYYPEGLSEDIVRSSTGGRGP